MRYKLILSALFLTFGIFNTVSRAQTSTDVGIKANLAGGEVTAVAEGKITLQTKDGALEVLVSDKTEFKRIPPDNPVLKAAVASSLTEIGTGDKLLVTGVVAADKKTVPAKAVYLITKADISKKQTKEQEEWRTRGIAGKVVTFNPQTNVLTVSVRGLMGERTVTVKPKSDVQYYRYAPDSVQFSEAKKSSIGEIELGDAIRVLGDKNADGSEMQAEKIVTGAFRTVGGTVTAINAETNEVTISDFQTKKPITVVVSEASVLKQFPADMAQRMAQFQAMQAGGAGGGLRPPTQGGTGAQQNSGGQTQPQTPPNGGGQGGFGNRGGGGIDEMLERFPNIKVTDLKVGEMIAVSSTKSADPNRIRAIKLLSGVEPFLRTAQAPTGGGRGGNRGGGDSGFSIPGLDGFGTP
jgi:hypothetical protein